MEKVYYDQADSSGQLSGGYIWRPYFDPSQPAAKAGAEWTTLIANGDPANRIDLVCVGDGYTADELGLYAGQVDSALAGFFLCEPFATYRTLFNVHRIDVVSNESGVDNDPVLGIERDTALDMGFFCDNLERLLCIDVDKAYGYAENAPDVDQVLALANSEKYGGAGYNKSNLATFAGGNPSSLELVLHEFGHSLGDLADEYYYYDERTYHGPEPRERNVSTLDAEDMAASGTKWAGWLWNFDPEFCGLTRTYEGAVYVMYGVYRPTSTSKMRYLDEPFNLPSVESLLLEIYREVDPIDDATAEDVELAGAETLFVQPVAPVGHTLDIQWFVDGEVIPGATGTSLDLGRLYLPPGPHLVAVRVVDNTPWVRDQAVRDEFLTSERSWEFTLAEASPVAEAWHLESGLRAASFPNPFNPLTQISFDLDRAQAVRLEIFDLQGNLVITLADGNFPAGENSVTWRGVDSAGRPLPSGAYLARIEAAGPVDFCKLLLVR